MSKPEKIFLNNTNLMYALTTQNTTDTLRETAIPTVALHTKPDIKNGIVQVDDVLLLRDSN